MTLIKRFKNFLLLVCLSLLFVACLQDNENPIVNMDNTSSELPPNANAILLANFGNSIDLENLSNYENQPIPEYIDEDNTENNPINNAVATLGRVLFYDANLSVNNTVSCASCHKQSQAFGDPAALSEGVNGLTARHSMRLINARFAEEENFFWDERANSLEQQSTMPIQDHVEMGFSGENGNPSIEDLLQKLQQIDYYPVLFSAAFGDEEVTEQKMQLAFAQFIRSIQSFDSKYDAGRNTVNNRNNNFPNFTNQENLGKRLFQRNIDFDGNSGIRIGGGLSCARCHEGDEFAIDDNSDNNGVIAVAGNPNARDANVTRSPTLRDLFNPDGQLNGPLMHTGNFDANEMLEHYNAIESPGNPNLDNILARGGGVQLNMTLEEKEAVIAFLKTLTGSNVYQDEKWSNPFLN